MKKTTLFLAIAFLSFAFKLQAQYPIISPAVENAVTLTFPVAATNAGSVAWNPLANLYYSSRIGNATYPMITWSPLGVILDHDTTGQDTRGMWWNPNLEQLERNCFNTIGWAKINLDANYYAENTFSVLFTGLLQPNIQSVGAYDPLSNQVVYYNAGTLYKYSRSTGSLVSSIALSGATLTNITSFAVAYTGITGSEIAIYDFSLKKVLLFDKNTGVFSGSSTLPATAPAPTQYGIAYANKLFWVYKGSPEYKWYSYRIFDIPLPVYDIQVSGDQIGSANLIQWTVNADEQVMSFELERSIDGQYFNSIAIINGSTDGTMQYEYMDITPQLGANYYRVTSTDAHDQQHTSDIIIVNTETADAIFQIYPNPADDVIRINAGGQTLSYIIYDELGRQVFNGIIGPDGAVPLEALVPGNYYLYLASTPIRFVKK